MKNKELGHLKCFILPRAQYLSSGGNFTTVDFPGASFTAAYGINDLGDIVGTEDAGGMLHGFLYDGNFTTAEYPGGINQGTHGINNQGEFVGGYYSVQGGGVHGFLYDGNFTSFDFPGATETGANAINDLGYIVGEYKIGPTSHGFLRDPQGNFTTVDFPGASDTILSGVNNLGDIVGWYSAGGVTHGFVLKSGNFTTIDFPGSPGYSAATGINDLGMIVGFYGAGGTARGFLWQESAPVSADFFLHGAGSTANPPTLFLDKTAPTSATAKYRDSPSISRSGGNPWKEIGTWPAAPSLSSGTLTALSDLHVWLGLKNSDDQGTNFDLRAEVYKNGVLVASGETYCIQNITRNPNLAKEATVSFVPLSPVTFNGTTDVLSLKVLTRVGTDGTGGSCGGHANAVGLRLYFDAVSRPSRFVATF